MRAWLVLVIACGGPTAPPPAPSGPPASLVATRAAADDVEVAKVNGRPVWGSCVAAQAARGQGMSRDEALRQCIDFELLAQTAESRGLATDRDVIVDTRTALVSELVAQEFEDKYTRPAEFGDFWTKLVDKNRWRVEHPEVRGSAYVRVPHEHEAIGRELAAALGKERGLVPEDMRVIAERVLAGRVKLDFAVVPPDIKEGRLDATYVNALFAIPDVGRTSPPIRTKWGWDIILFESVIAAAKPTPDELVAAMLPDVKRSYFPLWVNKIAQSLGVKIKIIEANVQELEHL